MSISKLLQGASIAILSLACGTAFAGSATLQFPDASLVHFSDLNLDRPRDVARLYHRIAVAADKVCGPRFLGGLPQSSVYTSCYHDAVAQAVAHVNQPRLTAYYEQRMQPAPADLAIARK